jgi:hypothetical protein
MDERAKPYFKRRLFPNFTPQSFYGRYDPVHLNQKKSMQSEILHAFLIASLVQLKSKSNG